MTPSYFAVITAGVLFDREISNDGKILFGHISILSNKLGYCFASNSYFAGEDVMNCAKETISRRISQLEKRGHIKTQIIYEEDGKTIKERRIFILTAGSSVNTPIDATINRGIDAGVKNNNIKENNIKFNKSLSYETEREVLKKTKREESFDTFYKRVKKEFLGKDLASGVDGFFLNTIFSLTKTGFLHNKTSGKDLRSEDATRVWGWLFENKDKIGNLNQKLMNNSLKGKSILTSNGIQLLVGAEPCPEGFKIYFEEGGFAIVATLDLPFYENVG